MRRSITAAGALIEALEDRRLFGVALGINLQDPDDADIFGVVLNGPGALTVVPGTRLISVAGSTSASSLTVTLLTPGGDGRLAWNKIAVTGGMNALTAPLVDISSGANPALTVSSNIKSATIGDLRFADITLSGTQAATVLKGRFFESSSVHAGALDSLTVDNIFGTSTVEARRIGALVVHNVTGGPGDLGRAAQFGLTVSGPAPFAVKTMVFDGDLNGGLWTIAGGVQSIKVGRAIFSIAFPLVANIAGRLGSYTGGRLVGVWTAQSFGTIRSTGLVNGQFHATAGDIDSIVGDDVGLSVSTVGNFGIKSIVAGSDLVGGIDADWVDSILVTGGGVGPGGATLTMNLRGAANRPLQLRTLNVAGTLRGHIDIAGNVGNITLGGADLLYLNVGATPLPEQFITSTAEVAPGQGNVRLLKIKGVPPGTENLQRTVINVRRFETLISQAVMNPFIPLSPFGIRFLDPPGAVNFRVTASGLPDQFITSTGEANFSLFEFTYRRVV